MERTARNLKVGLTLVRSIIGISVGATLVAGFNNCSEVAFEQLSSTEQVSPRDQGGLEQLDDKTFEYAASLNLSSNSKALDIIWVIDNSRSMSAEAAHVRDNLSSFIASVSSLTDLRLAIISSSDSNTGVRPPSASSRTLFIEQFVDSHDSLSILSDKLKRDTRLREFLRPDSQKIFVIVTDDDSSMLYSEFQSSFEAEFPRHPYTVFGFIAIDRLNSPCLASPGNAYKSLSETTGGETFNICEPNWGQHFRKLTASVVRITNQTLTLPHGNKVARIISVSLNGRTLQPSEFSFSLKGITVNDSALMGLSSASIRVTYELQ